MNNTPPQSTSDTPSKKDVPSIELPKSPETKIDFQTKDIGKKTAVKRNLFVNVISEVKFSDRLKAFFQKIKAFFVHIFTGKRLRITIPVIVLLLAGLTFLILFLCGVFNIPPAEITKRKLDESIQTTMSQVDSISKTSDSTYVDTAAYLKNQIKKYEADPSATPDSIYIFRKKLADYYWNLGYTKETYNLLVQVKEDGLSAHNRLELYGRILDCARSLGEEDVKKEYEQKSQKLIESGELEAEEQELM